MVTNKIVTNLTHNCFTLSSWMYGIILFQIFQPVILWAQNKVFSVWISISSKQLLKCISPSQREREMRYSFEFIFFWYYTSPKLCCSLSVYVICAFCEVKNNDACLRHNTIQCVTCNGEWLKGRLVLRNKDKMM